ncbi:MAG: PilT protein domain protein [Caulobacteraceae bacterium]|jgi:ribonuclease VapC|nr:PilT protein domain protein [Caulobacteraceae bacterium]
MIAVDTSALMAILLGEPEADACARSLEEEGDLLISAATLTEVLIVAGRRGLADQMAALIGRLDFTVAPLFEADARRAAQAHAQWGKGVHRAALNFGDCFAYALAKQHGCPLLYVGEDFARTDLVAAMAGDAP